MCVNACIPFCLFGCRSTARAHACNHLVTHYRRARAYERCMHVTRALNTLLSIRNATLYTSMLLEWLNLLCAVQSPGLARAFPWATFILSYKLAPEARENRNHAGADSIGNGLVANGSQPLPAQTANSAAAMEGACISAAGWALHQAASVDVFWQNLAA